MEYPLESIFQYLLKNGVLKFFEQAVGPPLRCPRFTLQSVPFQFHDLKIVFILSSPLKIIAQYQDGRNNIISQCESECIWMGQKLMIIKTIFGFWNFFM